MTDLVEALSDVRKAYRLVWAYQRRMMDLIQVIADDFEGLQFYAWSPLHTRRPTQLTTNPLERKWAWDMVPFYKVSFLYKPVGADPQNLSEGDWLFEMHLDTDTAGFNNHRGEPDASKFPDAESSQSTLTLFAWQCMKPTQVNWVRQVWALGDWPSVDGVPEELSLFPIRVIKQTTGVETLHDKAAVKTMIDKFKGLISEEFGIFVSTTTFPR